MANKLSLREEMYRNIKAYNKNYKDEYLDQFTIEGLLPFCHPADREKYKLKIFNQF